MLTNPLPVQDLSKCRLMISRNKIVTLGDEALNSCSGDPDILALYMLLFTETCEARLKISAIFICDHIIRSTTKSVASTYRHQLLHAFQNNLPALYYFARSALNASMVTDIGQIDKCFRIWQEKSYFLASSFFEAKSIWDVSQLVHSVASSSLASTLDDLQSTDSVARLLLRYKNLATLINCHGLTAGDKMRHLRAFVSGKQFFPPILLT